jgi:hypothetical protein
MSVLVFRNLSLNQLLESFTVFENLENKSQPFIIYTIDYLDLTSGWSFVGPKLFNTSPQYRIKDSIYQTHQTSDVKDAINLFKMVDKHTKQCTREVLSFILGSINRKSKIYRPIHLYWNGDCIIVNREYGPKQGEVKPA